MIQYRNSNDFSMEQVIELYRANAWSAADKPKQLYAGLVNSHTVVTAWDEGRLVGLGNAISDGHLVVYYPHLLVHPDYQRLGIGKRIAQQLMGRYRDFHQQTLLADHKTVEFYRKLGYVQAGCTEPMWIYDGNEH